MARTAEKVRALVAEDAEMEAAVETVLERAEEGELQWSDVSDELTSGQWGRLIEEGIVVGGDEGMRLADGDAIREGLYGDPDADAGGPDDEAPEGGSWTTWDKIAGLAALSLFPGYYFNSVRDAVGGFMDIFLGPFDTVLPFYGVILVLAVLTGLYSTLLQDNLMNTERIAYYQEQMQEIQERRKAAKERGDDEAVERIQQEQMEAMTDNLSMFAEQLRPMVWTMLLIIPAFLWMYWKIFAGNIDGSGIVVFPLVGELEWTDGIAGPMQAWIVWYFVCSMGFSQILRKALDVRTSPSGGSSDTDSADAPEAAASS